MQFRLRSLFLAVAALAVCLALGKYLLILASWLLLGFGMAPFSYVIVPAFALWLDSLYRYRGPLRAVVIASLLTIPSPLSMTIFGCDYGGGYGLPFTLAVGYAGPTYAAFLAIRFRRRELIQTGEIDPQPTVGSALSEAIFLLVATAAMAAFTYWSYKAWGGLWNWTSITVDRRMPYLLGIGVLATIGLLWKAMCRASLAWRLTRERRYAKTMKLPIADTPLETNIGD